jgi:hypothetical protein
MVTLLLSPSDMANKTKLSGNLDIDILTPFIYQAQITDIKRVLTTPLYDEIYRQFDSATGSNEGTSYNMTGEYKIIYEGFVVDMLVYYSASNFMKFGAYQINNSGIYKFQPTDGVAIDLKEVDNLVNRYNSLGQSVEKMFIDYMGGIDLPEYDKKTTTDVGSFPWFF